MMTFRAGRVVVMYGVVHAIIDASTVTTLFRAGGLSGWASTFWLVVLYNVLAFALQAVIGPVVDWVRAPRGAALAGTVLALAALVLYPHIPVVPAVVIAGLGNALFHLGGGSIALNSAPTRSAPSGVFVAPGALGLATGIFVGHRPAITAMPIALALVLAILAQAFIRAGSAAGEAPGPETEISHGAATVPRITALVALGLLLGTVFVRAVVGSGASHALVRSVWILFGLAIAAFLGKLLGGFVADRIGWIRASVGALCLSFPLLILGQSSPWAVAAGVLIFQATMPVTLTATAALLPGRPATAFGLCCLALVAGAAGMWPPHLVHWVQTGAVLGSLILFSAVGIGYALALLRSRLPSAPPRVVASPT